MGLSEREKAILKQLQDKAEQPDPAPVGKSVNVTIDLGNEEQVKRAVKYGFLPADEAELSLDESGEQGGEGGGEGERDPDTKPGRRGYFG